MGVYTRLLEAELASLIDERTGTLRSDRSRLVPCAACRTPAEKHGELFIKRGFRFVVCPACGLIFANPMVDDAVLAHLYGSADSLHEAARLLKAPPRRALDFPMYSALARFIGGRRETPSPRCLEVSLRGGLILASGAMEGWSVDLVDLSGPTRAVGMAAFPRAVFFDGLEAPLEAGRRYDAILCTEALEHFSNPVEKVEKIFSMLTGGGVFGGVLSNAESLLVRLLGKDAPLFDGLYQKFFFHTGSLRRILEDAGFIDIRFDAFAPAADHVGRFLNRMIPEGVRVDSADPLAALITSADMPPLRYKLMFAARRPGETD
ncbi:MAG: methyltransferase domain-containing protein [Desulfobacterales bacterium]|nr:methyltransferase domain-containing protein [Desulfobacterales bacterium]